MNTKINKSLVLFAAMVALMAVTRSHHFDALTHMPDASLAVFLLAGIYLPLLAFPILLVVAGVSDYAAFNFAGVSDWCYSPAYWFLIPTYAVMFFAGRYYAPRHTHTLRSLAMFCSIAFAATSVAFFISSGSFFLFSGRFAEMSTMQYTSAVAQYFLPYQISAFMYLSAAVVVQIALSSYAKRPVQA